MNLKNEILKGGKTFLIVMILFFAVQFIYAWTGPNLPPPQDNTPTPINVSSTAQTKTGQLTVGGLNLPAGAVITGGGSVGTYGATSVYGEKSGWSGIDFRNNNGNSAGTLMMHGSYSGFYNSANNNWRWYATEGGNTYQPGYVQASDVYAGGRWMSSIVSDTGVRSVTMNCYSAYTGCPYNGYLSGYGHYCSTCVDGVCSGYVVTGYTCY
jgi:hypothetical protein